MRDDVRAVLDRLREQMHAADESRRQRQRFLQRVKHDRLVAERDDDFYKSLEGLDDESRLARMREYRREYLRRWRAQF